MTAPSRRHPTTGGTAPRRRRPRTRQVGWAPRAHRGIGDAESAFALPAGLRRTPGAAVPPLVVERAIGADAEHVEAVGAPRHRARRAQHDAATRIPAPGRAAPRQ